MAEKTPTSSSSSGSSSGSTAVKDDKRERTDVALADERDGDVEQAPAPEPPETPTISIGGPAGRPVVERADRGTYISPPVRRNDDSDVPDEFVDMPEESTEVEGEPVEVFQVISSSGALALRLDGQVFILDPQQAQAFQGHIKAGLMNVVH